MSRSKLILILLPLLVLYAVVKNSVDHRMIERRNKTDIRYLPSPQFASITALGYKAAMADTFWIEALNYFGWQLTSKNRTYEYLPNYLELILKLDRYFTMFYEWAATAFIYNGFSITRPNVVNSQKYVNEGIRNLNEVQRFDANIWSKGAFNFALEARDSEHSVPYFEFVGRAFPDKRDYLLVGSTYAGMADLDQKSVDLKLEYLGFIAFEARSKSQIDEALALITSPRFNKNVGNFILNLRVRMEKDEDVRKLVKNRWEQNSAFTEAGLKSNNLNRNEKLEAILNIDMSRNWMPPDLHLLLIL